MAPSAAQVEHPSWFGDRFIGDGGYRFIGRGWSLIDTAHHSLIGRDQDLAVVAAFLRETTEGFSLLALEGEAGIGKTSLWEAAVGFARASGFSILTAHPSEAEGVLSFVALSDLLEGVGDDVWSALPPSQRAALEVASARSTTEAPVESGAVAIAFLSAVRGLVVHGPLLIAIDDYQWLDRPSARVVEFALRRLTTEPVRAIVTSRRESQVAWERSLGHDRVTRQRIEPLSVSALHHLIYARSGVPLGRPTLLRVHETSRGNPFFALELARELLEHREDDYRGRPLPLPDQLNDLLRSRLGRQSRRTRRLLAAAAVMSSPRVEDLGRFDEEEAADVLDDLERAEQAGIVAVRDGVIEFNHPMLGAAAYAAVSPSERDRVHARLSVIVVDPEEASRHLALARRSPDGEAAAQLAKAAERALSRGATDIAAFFAEQALRLTPSEERSDLFQRAVAAGSLVLAAGNHPRARELFDRALASAEDGEQRAIALLQMAQLASPLGEAIALSEQALTEAPDSSLRSRIHRLLGAISYALGDVARAESDAREAVRLAEQGMDAEALGLALAELAHWTFCGGGGYREDLFSRAVSLDPSAGASSPRSHYAKVTLDAGYMEKAGSQLDQLLAEDTAQGDLQGVATHRLHLAQLEMWRGNFHRAIEHADESLLLHEYSDQPSAPRHVKAMSLACIGRVDLARKEAEFGLAEAEKSENVFLTLYNLHVLGFIELSLGNPSLAHVHLSKAIELHRPRWNREFGDAHFVPDEIEALLAIGDLLQAEDLVVWMEQVGAATARIWTVATAARSRGLLLAAQGRMADAEQALQTALHHHQELPMPFELARTLLVHGSLQRRRKQRAGAAQTLNQAHDIFVAIGSQIWAEKAQAELARIGVRSQVQRSLTPIEQRVALLASQGCNNREIADLLFVSRKTVEANLTHVYRKLGIHSRAQLGTALSQSEKKTPPN